MGTICAVIPTYNRAHLLPQCLDSLLKQTRHVDEIVIVNDGSTDNTLEMLTAYGPRLTVVTQANAGKAAAMNTGLQHSSADYLWFCDDDDLTTKDAAAIMAGALDADPSLDFVYGKHLTFTDGEPEKLHPRPAWGLPHSDRPLIDFLGNLYPFQMAMLVRRSAFEKSGTFDTKLLRVQDFDFLIRLALRGAGRFVPEVIFLQREHFGMRGTAANPIAAKTANSAAIINDRNVLLRYLSELTLERVEPAFAKELPAPLKKRASLIQRACILARRAIWRDAIADIKEAAQVSNEAAARGELSISSVAIMDGKSWEILMGEPETIDLLHALYAQSPYTAQIVRALLKPVFWHAKGCLQAGEYRKAWQRVRLILRVLGYAGCLEIGMSGIKGKLQPGR